MTATPALVESASILVHSGQVSFWKCLLNISVVPVVSVVALSLFVRAATFAERNLPALGGPAHSLSHAQNDPQPALLSSSVRGDSSAQEHSRLPFKRGPVSMSKIFVRNIKSSNIPLPEFSDFSHLRHRSLLSYIFPTASRPPSNRA